MKTLRYISAQPTIDYYTWQVEVMINNFIKSGINPNHIDIVCSIKDGVIPESWSRLANHYNYVRFFFYEDTRENPTYISSVRPNILKKHFTRYPELKNDAIMYHDCDILFTQHVNWNKYLDDDIWYGSDTGGYVGARYVKSKEFGIYEEMCKIIGIGEDLPTLNENNTIGAQYLMKNVTAEFWEKVELDCESLYKFFTEHLKQHPASDKYHPIQKWTADMWAVLWNAWYFGNETKCIDDMNFIWPGWKIKDWEDFYIFHNAGVTENHKQTERLFFKGDYINKLPYDINLDDYDETKCSYKYVQEILETANRSCLI